MTGDRLNITPRGRWETIAARSYGWLIFLPLFTSSMLRDELGFWGSLGVTIGTVGLPALLLIGFATPERKYRLARDAEHGILECAIRYPESQPGSLRSRWLPGFAEVTRGSIKFQPDLSGEGSPNGTIRPFSDATLRGPVEVPAKRPAELKRGWKIVELATDEGLLHLATGDTGLKLIEERFGDHGA